MLLTAGERTLLHLLNFWNVKDPPEAITQQGIAAAAGLRRAPVPRTVKAPARAGHLGEGGGVGKSALGRGFRARASRAHVWRDLSPEATADAVLHDLAAYLRDRGRDQLGEALWSGTGAWGARARGLAGRGGPL